MNCSINSAFCLLGFSVKHYFSNTTSHVRRTLLHACNGRRQDGGAHGF
jgi:hypothetical protein